MARWVLIVALVSGLVPSLGEGVELVVHYAATGHVAHWQAGETDLGDQGAEHGCGPLAHHCGCCYSQPVVLAAPARQLLEGPAETGPVTAYEGHIALGVQRRLLRPPIRA